MGRIAYVVYYVNDDWIEEGCDVGIYTISNLSIKGVYTDYSKAIDRGINSGYNCRILEINLNEDINEELT